MPKKKPTNEEIAELLDQVADLLEAQAANPHRIRAYQSGANTARAHELGTTQDWVVIYYQRSGQGEQQVTVVTETNGALAGKRVVHGREADAKRYYAARD